jgi:hypothetical protein
VSQPIDLVRNSLPAQGKLILLAAEETDRRHCFSGARQARAVLPSLFPIASVVPQRIRQANARLAVEGKAVEIHLQTPRFRCRNAECDQKIFAERLPAVADPKARQTTRLCEIVGLVDYSLGGLPGERLLKRRNQD